MRRRLHTGHRFRHLAIVLGAVLLQAVVLPRSIDAFQVNAAAPPSRTLQATRLQEPVKIDGHLDDRVWESVPKVGDFMQREPDEGKPATERTDVRIACDSAALYVGIRLWDSQANRIGRRLARRDTSSEADSVTLYLDPYHDRRTGVMFDVTAAGVQSDSLIYDDYLTDSQWDAVWQSAVSVDTDGWSVEIRVPWSQLRFANAPEQVWGINVSRYLLRRAEESWLQVMPRNAKWLASRMADLEGLHGLNQPAHLELLPYVTGRASFVAAEPGDPFHDGRDRSGDQGLDVRWTPSSTLTLNATVRPDFGQVEVDPSVVNLTEFETFFSEKRPFFVEGARIFTPATGDSLFYSRRIGRVPQGKADGDYVDSPPASTILGAAKLTGKIGRWTIGFVDAVTAREWASVANDGIRSRVEVEPLTNYLIGRIRNDKPRAGLGATWTTMTRQLRTADATGRLASSAYAFGGDGYGYLDARRTWKIAGTLQGSVLNASAAAITRQQKASRRYYQRPDVSYVSLDSTATSMDGWRSQVEVGRQRGTWQVDGIVAATSPGFEINDLGYQTRADRVLTTLSGGWAKYSTNHWSRSRSVKLTKKDGWNFGQQRQSDLWSLSSTVTFLNYWYVSGSTSIERRVFDDHLTRGGPLGIDPGRWNWSATVGSDSRKPVSFYVGPYWSADNANGSGGGVSTGLIMKPARTVTMSFSPSYYGARYAAQYVTTVSDANAIETLGARYVFAPIDFKQISMTTRVDLAVTPHLSIQAYIEPFVSVGRYGQLMEYARPRTFDFLRYGVDRGTVTADPSDASIVIDPDGGGPSSAFTVYSSDYNSKSFVTKAVLRWEWRPGSTLYLAWTQRKWDGSHAGSWDFSRDVGLLLRAPADNVVLVKMSYWLGR
jgi:hypothetical protein